MFFSFSKFPLFLVALFSLGVVACNGESSEEQNSSKGNTEEPLPGFISDFIDTDCYGENCRFQKVAGKEEFGFDVFIDTKTFRFSEPPGQEAYQLTEPDLEKLFEWRNKKGIPWAAWAYGKDSSFESHEAFSIIAVSGAYFINDEVLEKVIRFLAEEKGIKPVEDIVKVLTYQEMFPENPELQDPEKLNYKLSGWFRENVAALSDDLYYGISEAFAWYTSPSYQKGTLPSEIEEAMDLIKQAKFQNESWSSVEQAEVVERAAKIIKMKTCLNLVGRFMLQTLI